MDMPVISEPQDNIAEQLKALDEVIKRTESMLKESDDFISTMIERRGKMAADVQHLWIRRHQLNREFERIREEQRRNLWQGR